MDTITAAIKRVILLFRTTEKKELTNRSNYYIFIDVTLNHCMGIVSKWNLNNVRA